METQTVAMKPVNANPPDRTRDDAEITLAAERALAWNASVPLGAVRVAADGGWITLSGTLTWDYQRRAAELAVRHLDGVTGVTNDVLVRRTVSARDIKARIAMAFREHAEIDASRVNVEIRDGQVTLRGTVRSAAERQEAERAALAAPGVTLVDDRIVVIP
jgi:osmotically-inducible protein OsmY